MQRLYFDLLPEQLHVKTVVDIVGFSSSDFRRRPPCDSYNTYIAHPAILLYLINYPKLTVMILLLNFTSNELSIGVWITVQEQCSMETDTCMWFLVGEAGAGHVAVFYFFASVTKHQHLSHGSGSLRNWVDFIWESDFVVFLLLAQRLDPEADVPPRHRPSGWRVRARPRDLVLGLNLGVRGQMKVRVMAGVGSRWGQSMQPP